MKKSNHFRNILLAALVLISQAAWAQDAPIIKSIPNQTAVVGSAFSYTVEVLLGDPAPQFELTVNRPGMIINSSTGVINWTPGSLQDGGLVTVRAWNSQGEHTRSFKIFVAEALPADPDMIAYWKMEDASASIFANALGTGMDAYVAGAVTNEDGLVGGAKGFYPPTLDTEYGKVTHTSAQQWARNESFSISLWFKHNGGGASGNPENVQFLVSKGGTGEYHSLFQIYLDKRTATPQLGFQVKNKSESTYYEVKHPYTITNDTWYHVVAEYVGADWPNSATIKLIINRNVATNTSVDFNQNGLAFDNIPGHPIGIGYWDYFKSYPFSGTLDDITLWDKALSTTEISNLYNDGAAGIAQYPKADNFAPIFASEPVTEATEDEQYTYTVVTSDYENEGLDLEALILPSWLTLNTSTGLLYGTPGDENTGDTVVSLQLTDGNSIVFQNFDLTVTNVSDPPEITSTPPSTEINEGEEFTYTVVVVDSDPGDVVTLTGLEIPDWMTFTPATGVLTGTPTNEQVQYSDDSTFSISIEARDLSDQTDVQTFDLKVINVNDVPVIVSQSDLAMDRNTDLLISTDDIVVEDPDDRYPADHTLSILAGDNYSFSGLTLTPDENYYGDLVVKMQISDGKDDVPFDLAVTVNFVNIEPEFTSTPVTTAKEGAPYIYVIVVEDADTEDPISPQTLSVVGQTIPSWATLDVNTMVLSGIPNRASAGANNVRIEVSDGIVTVPHEFVINVDVDNQKPIITSTPVTSVNNYSEYVYTVTAVDGDATDTLSCYAVSIPSWLSFDEETATLSGTPEKVDVGDHDISLMVTDGYDEVPHNFKIRVNNVNTAPVVLSEPMDSIKIPKLYTYVVVARDNEGDPMIYNGVTIPEWLTFDANSRVLSGKPTLGDEGDHDVAISISDGLLTTLHEFTITVYPQFGVGIESEISMADKIYPNPATNYVIFELNSMESVNIEIMDLSGKRVMVEQTDGSGQHVLDVAHLSSGLYMYRIFNGDQMESGKLIIE